MKKIGILLVGLVMGVLAVNVARANWTTANLPQRPGVISRAPGAPTKKTTVGAAEVNWTLSEQYACVRFSCDVASEYLVGTAGGVTAASGTGNQIPANTVERFCLTGTSIYVSAYLSGAGHCWLAEITK